MTIHFGSYYSLYTGNINSVSFIACAHRVIVMHEMQKTDCMMTGNSVQTFRPAAPQFSYGHVAVSWYLIHILTVVGKNEFTYAKL